MFAKVTTVFALFLATAQVAIASPPACLVAGVNIQPNPSDVSAVCKNATAVEQFICQSCAGNIESALSAFSSYCGSAGVTINTSNNTCSSSTSSSSSSSTITSTGTSTGSFSTGTSLPTNSNDTLITAPTPTSTGTHTGTSTETTKSMATSTVPGKSASMSASSSATSTSPSSTSGTSAPQSTGNAATRLGMDIVGMVALGVFGAMLAM